MSAPPLLNPKGIATLSPTLPSLRGYVGRQIKNQFNRNAVVAMTRLRRVLRRRYRRANATPQRCLRGAACSTSTLPAFQAKGILLEPRIAHAGVEFTDELQLHRAELDREFPPGFVPAGVDDLEIARALV